MNNRELMISAKQKLSGHWMDAAIGALIFIVLTSLAECTAFLQLILYGPIFLGYLLYMMCLADTKVSNFNLIFNGFQRFGETLVAGLLVQLIVALGLILLIVPGIIWALSLSMTFFIMADDPTIGATDAMKMSRDMMRGHKWDLFCLHLRFIGWYLLAIITCGIGFLWVYPYITISQLNFYRQLRYNTY